MTGGSIGPGSRSLMLSSPRVRIHFCATCSPASSTRSRSGPSLLAPGAPTPYSPAPGAGRGETTDRVGLARAPLRLVGPGRGLDPPQVPPPPVGVRRLHRRDHVLVAGDQHRVGDRAMPGERLHVGADLIAGDEDMVPAVE